MASADRSKAAAGNSTIAATLRRAIEEAPPAEGVRVTIAPDAAGRPSHRQGNPSGRARLSALRCRQDPARRTRPLPRGFRSARAPRPAASAASSMNPFSSPARKPSATSGSPNCATSSSRRKPSRSIRRPEISSRSPAAAFPASGSGPSNFHSYQTNLRRLHRERFARMPFALYSAKVRTERGEEAVNAWLETMKTKDPLADQGRRRRRMDRRPRRSRARARHALFRQGLRGNPPRRRVRRPSRRRIYHPRC